MDLHFGVGLITAMLAAALIVGIIAERIHIPYSVALLIAATPIHVNGLEQHFESSLLFVFLPLLIFEAAWNVDTRLLRTNWAPVFLMAVPGVLLTAGLVGFGLSLFNQLPFMPALLLGAILSATDPVALIPILRRLAVPHELAAIVEGESLLNDGVAIVLYTLLVGAVVNGTSLDALTFLGKSLLVSAGGVLIGVVVALAIAFLLRLTNERLLYFVASVVALFIAYLGAEHFHFSGIFAAVSTGIALVATIRYPPNFTPQDIGSFWAVLAFFANSLVFLLMGLRIDFPSAWHQPLLLALTIGFVLLARLFLAYAAFPLTKPGVPFAWRNVIALSGMRGAISIALALNLPNATPFRVQIIDATFGVVLITLVVQGIALGPSLKRMQLSANPARAASSA